MPEQALAGTWAAVRADTALSPRPHPPASKPEQGAAWLQGGVRRESSLTYKGESKRDALSILLRCGSQAQKSLLELPPQDEALAGSCSTCMDCPGSLVGVLGSRSGILSHDPPCTSSCTLRAILSNSWLGWAAPECRPATCVLHQLLLRDFLYRQARPRYNAGMWGRATGGCMPADSRGRGQASAQGEPGCSSSGYA